MDDAIAAVYRHSGRSTRAIVDLDQLERNIQQLKARLRPGTRWMGVVKANAYGHGAVMVARTCVRLGASMLGVATIAEARQLRDAGISARILVLGPIDETEVGDAAGLQIDITIGDTSILTAVDRAAQGTDHLSVHLKIDTGMHRYGVEPGEAVQLARRIAASSRMRLSGVMTHLARADEPASPSGAEQASIFRQVVDELEQAGLRSEWIHIANSGGALREELALGNLVRFGIAMYGCHPGPNTQLPSGVESPMTVVSRIRRLHDLSAGDGVSYGHTYVAERPERVALVPIGYADGYSRSLSNAGWMRVADAPCPVRGRVCMDQTVFGNIPPDVSINDVVVVADSGKRGPSWEALSHAGGTIPYELLSQLSPRVPRYYLRSGRVIAELDEVGSLVGL